VRRGSVCDSCSECWSTAYRFCAALGRVSSSGCGRCAPRNRLYYTRGTNANTPATGTLVLVPGGVSGPRSGRCGSWSIKRGGGCRGSSLGFLDRAREARSEGRPTGCPSGPTTNASQATLRTHGGDGSSPTRREHSRSRTCWARSVVSSGWSAMSRDSRGNKAGWCPTFDDSAGIHTDAVDRNRQGTAARAIHRFARRRDDIRDSVDVDATRSLQVVLSNQRFNIGR
jgi:hypothetical protein